MKVTERDRVQGHLGRARALGMPATLTFAEWQQTIADFNGMCAYCQIRPFTLLEHFIPIEIAGTHVKNCLPACIPCNMKKRQRTGESLIDALGQATIERVQRYLESRPENTNPAPYRSQYYHPTGKVTPKPLPTEGDPYQTMNQAAKELGIDRATLYKKVAQLNIPIQKFIRDKRSYLKVSDVARLKEIKDKPWTAGEKREPPSESTNEAA